MIITVLPPPFVGSDYYCETGDNNPNLLFSLIVQVYSDDPLWDGQQCPGEEAPCCTHPSMAMVQQDTQYGPPHEDIELRVCGDNHNVINEDTPLEVT